MPIPATKPSVPENCAPCSGAKWDETLKIWRCELCASGEDEEKEEEEEEDEEWCEKHEQPMWKNGMKCGGCLDEEEEAPPSTYESMTLDQLTEEKQRVEMLFTQVRKEIPRNALSWADCVTRISKLTALIIAAVLNK